MDFKKRMALQGKSKANGSYAAVPNYGMKESDLLKMKATLENVAKQSNDLATVVNQYQKLNLPELAEVVMANKYMLEYILGVLEAKGLVTKDEVLAGCKEVQLQDLGLKTKTGPVEVGDIIIMGFALYDIDTGALIEDNLKDNMAYKVGSKGLPSDESFIGMNIGDQRSFDVTFGEGFTHVAYRNKPIQMHVICKGIQVEDKTQHAQTPQETDVPDLTSVSHHTPVETKFVEV